MRPFSIPGRLEFGCIYTIRYSAASKRRRTRTHTDTHTKSSNTLAYTTHAQRKIPDLRVYRFPSSGGNAVLYLRIGSAEIGSSSCIVFAMWVEMWVDPPEDLRCVC